MINASDLAWKCIISGRVVLLIWFNVHFVWFLYSAYSTHGEPSIKILICMLVSALPIMIVKDIWIDYMLRKHNLEFIKGEWRYKNEV